LGHLEDSPGVNEAMALDEAVLLLALAGGSEAIVLAGGGLANPASCPESADVVHRAW
jgi:hypothetical protein